MKRINRKTSVLQKQDFLNLTFLSVLFILFVMFLTRHGEVYGSKTDWITQHAVFPEYFRSRFYQTGELFPNFAFNLGAGENIYNYAYYGLFSPVILLSYLLPSVPMYIYIQVSSVVLVIISTALFYIFLRNNGFGSQTVLFASFLFIFSCSLTFHSHKHIMFISYMPFVLLGMIAVDRLIENKGGGRFKVMFPISILGMVATSFFFSTVGILTVFIYAVYKYLDVNPVFSLQKFIRTGLNVALHIIIGIAMSGIVLLPLLYVVRHDRSKTYFRTSFFKLLTPELGNILYNSYGLGLTAIALFAIFALFFTKKKSDLFLGIAAVCLLFLPISAYLLNAGMYADGKVFIPMLPLMCLITAKFMKSIADGKEYCVKYIAISLTVLLIGITVTACGNSLDSVSRNPVTVRKLIIGVIAADILPTTVLVILSCRKTLTSKSVKYVFFIPLALMALSVSYMVNAVDKLAEKEQINGSVIATVKSLSNEIKEDSIYRSAAIINKNININRIFNQSFYTASVYSSTSSQIYNRFFYDGVHNPVSWNNRTRINAGNFLIFNILTGNKYIYASASETYLGYEKILEKDGIAVFRNENVLPVAYASSNLISEDRFNSAGYPENIPHFLSGITVDSANVPHDSYSPPSPVEKTNLCIDSLVPAVSENISGTLKDGVFSFTVSETKKFTVPIGGEYVGKILFISFRVLKEPEDGNIGITLNGVQNVLSNKKWKYFNSNYVFEYQIGIDSTELNVEILKGKYEITEFSMHTLDYSEIVNARNNKDEFLFDTDKTKGDVIEGSINVSSDGWFTASIPYDEGWRIEVDGKNTAYEKVNTAFIGFPINEGEHHIRMVYRSPFKSAGTVLSLCGITAMIAACCFGRVYAKKERRG